MRTRLKDIPVLELNASFEPIRVTHVKHAVGMIVKAKAVSVEDRDNELCPGFLMPSVIRLVEYRKVPHTRPRQHRKNIYLRDNNTCQYCGEKFPSDELTLDHILPLSRGGKTVWENLVACCHPCNQEKGDRTPEEWGHPLLQRVWPASVHSTRNLMRMAGQSKKDWQKYLFY